MLRLIEQAMAQTGPATPAQELAAEPGAEIDPAFQLRLEDSLRITADLAGAARAACALVGARLAVAQVVLFELSGPGSRPVLLGAWPDEAPFGVVAFALAQLGASACAQLRAGASATVADLRLDPALAASAVQAAWAARGCVAFACAPILREMQLAGLLVVAEQRARPWREQEQALLAATAARIWTAMDRMRLTLDLRRSEYEHRMAIALCPQIFWTATPDGCMDDLSPIFGQLTSARTDQRGTGWRQSTHPADLPAVERAVAHCLRTGETYDIEHRSKMPDGRVRWVHVHGKPARGPDGQIVRWFGTITDIDRRKRAEAALKESEERFLRAIGGARVGTWEWDMGTDEVVTSPGYAPQFHDLPEGTIRTAGDFLAAIHPDDRARLAAIIEGVRQQALTHGRADYEAEYRVVRRNGEVRWLGAQGTVTIPPSFLPAAAHSNGGRLSGLTVDMSERRWAEEMLTATQDRLRALNADLEATVRREVALRERAQALLAQAQRMEGLGQLAGGIAHDFNNVLQAVMGGLDLLERRADRPEAVRLLAARVGEAASRGVAITGRLLAFARRSDLQAEHLDVVPLLQGLRDMLAPTLKVGIAMRVQAEASLPPLLVDRAQLETALVNLAVNARDAMPNGGVIIIGADSAEVVAATDQKAQGGQPAAAPCSGPPVPVPAGLAPGRYVRVSVHDDGTGMSAEVLARASEPFFTTKPVGQGTGLGLAMARGFAEQSGGALVLASAEQEGTTVSLWFPASQGAAAEQNAEPEAILPTLGPPLRVMVVDDDQLVRSMLASQIEALGCLILEAEGGEAALDRLANGAHVDVLVTDYAMPGMSGASLAATVRERHPGLAVLLVTGHVEDGLLEETQAWEDGAFLLLRKPVSTAALSAALARLRA